MHVDTLNALTCLWKCEKCRFCRKKNSSKQNIIGNNQAIVRKTHAGILISRSARITKSLKRNTLQNLVLSNRHAL